MVQAVLSGRYTFLVNCIEVQIATGLKAVVFDKTVKMSCASRQKKNTGDVINLFTVDVNR